MSMRKVITVNLDGNAYPLEEPGYEALRTYLDTAEARLAGNPDQAEILRDLEQAIADRCSALLGPRRNVVTAEDMATILAQMGPVDTGEESDTGAIPGGSPRASRNDAFAGGAGRPRRRLYRLPDQGVLLGVCAGFAAYFDVDVVWVRVIALVLTVCTGGIPALVYFLLIFAMPRAETPEQVAEAHGLGGTARDVVHRLKKKFMRVATG